MCALFSLNQAPPEIQVACFVGSDHFKEILGDFTNKINWNNTNEVAKKCAKLAYANGYTLFALGKNGLCLSGADMKQKTIPMVPIERNVEMVSEFLGTACSFIL